jgi:DNA-binding NarL/FixJ family response regulator
MEVRMGRLDTNGMAEQERTWPAAVDAALAVLDPSRLRRETLRLALAHHVPGWKVLEFATADDLLHRGDGSAEDGLDLVILGAATAEHADLAAIEELTAALPETPIVVVAESDNLSRVRRILSAGARGFVPASLSVKVLIGALELVLAGGVYVPSTLIEQQPRAAGWGAHGHDGEPWSELTRRQRDVLALISQGKSNKLIADALTMSESTVKAHVKQIIKRLHVANRTQAALVATGRALPPPAVAAAESRAEP